MASPFDKTMLAPVRLRQQPEMVVEPISRQSQEGLGRLKVEQGVQLRPGETAQFMKLLDDSVGSMGKNGLGNVGFAGILGSDSGAMVCRGQGRVSGNTAVADGCLKQPGSKERILFIIETHVADSQLAAQLIAEYELAIRGLGWKETTEVTMQFEAALLTRARDVRDDGKTVMQVVSTDEMVDAVQLVRGLKKAPIMPRVASRIAMKVSARIKGEEVGPMGNMQKKLKPVRLNGLLDG